jgi:hypothetical protein
MGFENRLAKQDGSNDDDPDCSFHGFPQYSQVNARIAQFLPDFLLFTIH